MGFLIKLFNIYPYGEISHMRIIIVGVGEVGFHVAKALSEEDHDITVIDIDPQNVSEPLSL